MKSKLEQELINEGVEVASDCLHAFTKDKKFITYIVEQIVGNVLQQAQLGWISVADDLPANMQVVDVWSIHDPNAVGRYVNMTYEDFNDVMTFLSRPIGLLIPIEKATHWRPTPEPPEEQS